MKNREEIKRIINNNKQFIKEKFDVMNISMFGSYLRGEQSDKSDIDILVEFRNTIDLFEFIELENYLSEILDCKVDLVMKDTLKPRIKDRILKEAIAI
ncbi:MAG: nucleotidyltransferase family protein [Candidatus Cloacimonetes bacterium]|nr:nucleotidyltransferase family protein [Candidatus Cloacimonadota bacterium]